MVAILSGDQEGDAVRGSEWFEVSGEEWFDVEELFGTGEKVFGVEVRQAVDDSVGGEDGDAGGIHIDEGHHHGGLGKCRDGELSGAEISILVERLEGLIEGELELGGALPGV